MRQRFSIGGSLFSILLYATAVSAQSYSVSDLSPSGGSYTIPYAIDLVSATRINDADQIIGWNVEGQALVLTPVPEPESLAIPLALAVLSVLLFTRCRQPRLLFAIALFSSTFPRVATAEPTYHLTDLGTLPGGSFSEASGINASGQVVGDSETNDDVGFYSSHAFLYSAGTMTDLGTLGSGSFSQAFGINDSGQVVGTSYTSGRFNTPRAFLYSAGSIHDLGALGGQSFSGANAINSTGQVAGWSQYGSQNHATRTTGGLWSDLGTVYGPYSAANGINTSGQIVGWSTTAGVNNAEHAFLYSGGIMTDLGTMGEDESFASAINAAGQIVGYTSTGGSKLAFLFSAGTMMHIGTLGRPHSFAYGINASGQVVGNVSNDDYSSPTAFLYSGGSMIDLNSLLDAPSAGWNLEFANAINDSGWIVGRGVDATGDQHAFLLTPVPEPCTLVIAAGLMAGGRGRRLSARARNRSSHASALATSLPVSVTRGARAQISLGERHKSHPTTFYSDRGSSSR